jgi:hypothetical protein
VVGAGDDVHPHVRARRRDPEGVPLPLHHQARDGGQEQLGQAAALGARGSQREGERQHGVGVQGCSGAAGHASPGAAAAEHERAVRGQRAQHRCPGRVEPGRRLGHPPPGEPPRLLDERHHQADVEAGVAGRLQVRRLHPAASAVPEREQAAGTGGGVQVHPSRPGRCRNVLSVRRAPHAAKGYEGAVRPRDLAAQPSRVRPARP